ncbi:MAG: carboxypeptidase regulatory-like domain-containing protein [Candidatus Baltobacteraceae bacterium]
MKISRIFALALAAVLLAACNSDALPPTGKYASFKGTVIDGVSSKPVAGATVVVDTVLTTTTGTDGTFSFEKVPSGDIDYVVKAPDGSSYQSISDHVHADPLATATVTVKLSP